MRSLNRFLIMLLSLDPRKLYTGFVGELCLGSNGTRQSLKLFLVIKNYIYSISNCNMRNCFDSSVCVDGTFSQKKKRQEELSFSKKFNEA